MFRAAYCSSSGVTNCICSLWFIYPCGDRPLSRLGGKWGVPTQPGQQFGAPDDERFCRSKHVEPSINFGIINSITSLHLLVVSTDSLFCKSARALCRKVCTCTYWKQFLHGGW